MRSAIRMPFAVRRVSWPSKEVRPARHLLPDKIATWVLLGLSGALSTS